MKLVITERPSVAQSIAKVIGADKRRNGYLEGNGGDYTRWAKNFNLKEISKTLMYLDRCGVRNYDELAAKASATSEKFADMTKIIKDAEKRLTEIAVLKTHIINYSKTRDVYVTYHKSGYNKKFFEEHQEEITLHKLAKESFGK